MQTQFTSEVFPTIFCSSIHIPNIRMTSFEERNSKAVENGISKRNGVNSHTQLQFQTNNSSKSTFPFNLNQNQTNYASLKIIKEDVKNALGIQDNIINDLDFLPRGGGYSGERYIGPPHIDADQSPPPLLEKFNAEWLPHVASYMSWLEGYSIAIVCDTYRRLTSPEFQTPEHMRFVYILGLAADMLTNRPLLFDDLLDGNDIRNQRDAYHVAHPMSFMNDGILMIQMAFLLLKKHIPDNHPAKEEILAKSSSYDYQNTYYFLYNSRALRGLHSLSKYSPATGSKENGAGNPEGIPVNKMGIRGYYELNRFRAWGYVRYLVDLGRLAACYTSPELDLDIYYRTIDLATQVGCLTDDIIDYSKKQAVEDIRTGEFGSHIAILLEVVNHGYPDHIFGEEFRGVVPSGNKERTELQSIMQENFATGKEEDALKIMELFNKFNVKRMLGAWLESEIRELDKLIGSSQGKKLNTGWIRGTVLDIGVIFQIEKNLDGREVDKLLVTKVQEKYGESPDYFSALLSALIASAKSHSSECELLE